MVTVCSYNTASMAFSVILQKYDARGEGMIDGERLMMALGIIASGRERKEDGTDQSKELVN